MWHGSTDRACAHAVQQHTQLRWSWPLTADWSGCAAQVEDALIMGADYYETLEECALIPGCLPMGLGAP